MAAWDVARSGAGWASPAWREAFVLSSCCEAMLKAADGPPLDVASADELKYLEARLAARPGVGAAIVAAASVEV